MRSLLCGLSLVAAMSMNTAVFAGDGHDHSGHGHSGHGHSGHNKAHGHKLRALPAGKSASVWLTVLLDGRDYTLHLGVTGFRFSPERTGQQTSAVEGHAHLYVNGVKKSRIYGSWFHLPASWLTKPQNVVRVTLNEDAARSEQGRQVGDHRVDVLEEREDPAHVDEVVALPFELRILHGRLQERDVGGSADVRSENGVPVVGRIERGDVSRFPDALEQPTSHEARTATDVEATRPRADLEAVEEGLRHRAPHVVLELEPTELRITGSEEVLAHAARG